MANINSVEIPNVFKESTFEGFKTRLRDFFKNQYEFKDYDFEGSRLTVLIESMAYAMLYHQQFANGALFEGYNQTARLRSSVVQHAQDNGYMPWGMSASTNMIQIQAYYSPIDSSPRSITIPKGTKFTASIEEVEFYDYVTWEDVEVIRGIDKRYITDLNLVQGRIIRNQMTFGQDGTIVIQDPNIDRRYVNVYVNGAKWEDWSNKPIVRVGGTSTVFYQRETIDSFTEIYFGEGDSTVDTNGMLRSNYVGGLKPSVGDTIVLEYISTKGTAANGSRGFDYVDTIPNLVVEEIRENPTHPDGINDVNYVGSIGGGEVEDIERIRSLGPVMRETQRRCVTASDYETFISSRFGNIVQAIQCYTNPEKPGYAFIAIKPQDGLYLTTVQKEDIQNYLRPFNVSTITPVVHSPNYMYVKTNAKVTYAINQLPQTEEWLQGQILNSIDRYYTEEVEIFNAGFYTSKMNSRIDNTDVSILGTETKIGLVREIDNYLVSPMNGIQYNNDLVEGSIYSTEIKYIHNTTTSYDVHYVGTKKNDIPDPSGVHSVNTGLMLVGPFAAGHISGVQEYTGSDFDRKVIDGRSKYYVVGSINYEIDQITFDLGVLNKDPDQFIAAYIELHSEPTSLNIFPSDGTLIVFENNLRPQYTTIEMNSVVI
ncbi:baseplate wedge subunit [Aeromonas phage CC2]|uniref:Baseplate wedge protein gp6 n=1 Tax=Aeromonas phage CC2 TaxID=1204516 RepID=I6XLZ5_9CAUD|nr:baseplate wedge subunit [Aeromonas phage CC2]AFN39554.1 baseplate wedge subunit [Aeromonas phage CC2]